MNTMSKLFSTAVILPETSPGAGLLAAGLLLNKCIPLFPNDPRNTEDLWLLNRVIRGPTSYPLCIRGWFPSGINDLFTTRL